MTDQPSPIDWVDQLPPEMRGKAAEDMLLAVHRRWAQSLKDQDTEAFMVDLAELLDPPKGK